MLSLKTMPKTASAREIQRNYKKLFNYVTRTKEPLYLVSNNKPRVVILDVRVFEDMAAEKELTEEEALKIISQGDREYQEGRTKVLTSLKELR